MTATPSSSSSWRRLPYAVAAVFLAASALFPTVGAPPAAATVIEDELVLRPGEVYLHEDTTTVPMGNNLGGLDPDGCLTGGNIYVPQSELACHVFNVVVDAPREKILAGVLQLDILLEYAKPFRIPNCSVPAVTSVSCATHTMAFEAWQSPPLQIVGTGRTIIVDLPGIGYIQQPDDGTVPVGCDTIDGLPQHPPLPGQGPPGQGSTLTCTKGEGSVTDTPSAQSSESFGSEFPPLIGAVIAAGKCVDRPLEDDPVILKQLKDAEGVCPNIAVNLASIIGIGDYRLTLKLVDLSTIPKIDKSFELPIDIPVLPDGSVPGGGEPSPVIGGSSSGALFGPGEALPLPGSSLPGFGAPDGSLSGIDDGTVIGNDDLAAAIVNRGAKPLSPAGDPSTASMLLSMVFLPVGGLATLLVVVFRRRHRDDALVSGVGGPAIV